MQANELIQRAQFVVDPTGKKQAVQLDYATWEALLGLLEDLGDLQEIDRVRESGEEYVPWEQAKEELRTNGLFSSPL